MTIERAIKLLIIEHERAKTLDFVKNPVAWALYKVWKIADGGFLIGLLFGFLL